VHLQQWWQAEHERRSISTPVLTVPFHHSRSSAVREPPPLDAPWPLHTICYYGSAPELSMVEAVQQWAATHNATFEVRADDELLRFGTRSPRYGLQSC
jgi:hypothetical protein